jgi:tryptophan synthase alpha chain
MGKELKGHKTRIEETFDKLKMKGEKALVTFITAGDPDLGTTKKLIIEFEKRGVDVVELGVPFSDPMADGPTIQASSERALGGGTNLRQVLNLVKSIRKESQIPIILFGYFNPIFVYGIERFVKDARRAGVDGVLVVDLPPEEADDLRIYTGDAGLNLIYLMTPTSDKKRIRLVSTRTSGFVYYVSVTGVTGARVELAKTIKGFIKKIKKCTSLPICVGFGISTPAQAAEVGRWADGVVVGSAIVKVIEDNIGSKSLVRRAGDFVASLKNGMCN